MRSEKEKSAEEAYKKFLDIMLYDVPLKQLDDLVVNDVTGYGTTLDEKILEIERLRRLVIDQREQGAGYEINFHVNPVHRRINPDNGLAIFIDEIEITMNINGDKNIIPLRFSVVLELINSSWKIVHVHGSVAVNTEGDTWHKEEHLRKIEELEKLVSEKTEDLLTKNRELEIEASLERVRAVAMGMNKSDDLLSICEVSFKEFRKLGFDNIRNALIHIQYDEQKYFMDYDFADLTGGAITKIEYGSHPVVEDYLKQIRSAKDAFYQGVIKEDQLEEWKNFRRNSGQIDDPRLDKATALYYYFFSIGIGDIGISTFDPIAESQIKILKRFRNVFDLAYRRYNDIALAEEQARETQIQLALERVRARTMAMQSSNELKEVVLNMFDGLKSLGVDPTVCNISLIDKKTCDSDVWSAHQTDNGLITYRVFISHFEHPFRKKLIDSFLNKISFSVHELYGDLKKSYIQYLIDHVNFSKVPEEVTKSNENLVKIEEGIVLSAAYMKYGLLIVSRSHAISNDESDILQRFAKIFEQTYTRFLDLQKAEAQAREAQIEAALERVRSRTMGMQKSEELKEVIRVVYGQFVNLNILVEHAGFIMDYKERDDMHIWLADQHEIPYMITIPYFNSPHWNSFIDAKENGMDFFANHLTFEEKNKFYKDLFKFFPVPDESKEYYFSCPGLAISTVLLENVGLYIENFSGTPYSDDENATLMRFGKVFQQTYTRFLDLQKAEAQARESKIELSLERIRAQVTAMRESSELLDIVVTMRSEFVALGHEAHYFWHMRWLPDRYDKAMTSGDGTRIGMVMTLPRHIHGDVKLVADWEKSDEPTLVFAMDVDTAVEYVEKMITLGDFQQIDPQAPTLDDIRHIGGLTFVMARTTHGEIGFSLPGTVPNPSEESVTTLARFAGVFDLAYRRFEDLKEAEEKNKIIQADNERKTKELEDARQLQLSMLPKELPQLPNLDIAVYMKTATEVGGDYYDFNVEANGSLTVLVGDATGHGMMSGMMVSIMKSFFISNKANIELKQFFENSNNSIKDMQLGRLMMGLIGIQITTEKLIATNAGMPSLLYFRNKSQKAGEFVSNNLPLGGMKGTSYLLKTVRYEKGDTILLMSDGFAELKNSHNEQYGYVRIKEKFRSLVQKSSSGIIKELKSAASQWTNGSEPDDDVTFVVIKVK
jgi:serine phosphatase RsbU (regulator of sigma subunit)